MNIHLPTQVQIKSLFIFTLLFISGTTVFCQELDFTASIDTSKSLFKEKLTITVEIKGGTPGYKVFCLDGIIPEGGKVVANAQKINEFTYQFPKITLSQFFICVMDRKQKLLCRPEKLLTSN